MSPMLLPYSCWLCSRPLAELARHHVLARKGKAPCVVVCTRCAATRHGLTTVTAGTRAQVAELLVEPNQPHSKSKTHPLPTHPERHHP